MTTHRKSLPAALIATASTAVIVFQAQEHHRWEDHLSAREVLRVSGVEGKPELLSGQWIPQISARKEAGKT